MTDLFKQAWAWTVSAFAGLGGLLAGLDWLAVAGGVIAAATLVERVLAIRVRRRELILRDRELARERAGKTR